MIRTATDDIILPVITPVVMEFVLVRIWFDLGAHIDIIVTMIGILAKGPDEVTRG